MNTIIKKNDVEHILNKLGNIGDNGNELKISNLIHYQTAFVHKSFFNEENNTCFKPLESYERLEFLGDSFLGAVTARYLFSRFTNEQEGFLTKIRTRLVRSSMCYRFARFLELGKFILISKHIGKLTTIGSNKGRNNPKLYEDCFEAFIGAIIHDHGDEDGYRYAKRFIINIIEHLIDFSELIMCNENFKDTLQRYFQSLKWTNPVYIDLYEGGPSHMKSFVKGVFLKNEYIDQLPVEIKMLIDKYNATYIICDQLTTVNVRSSSTQHCLLNNCTLIGLAVANKKNIAEQTASNVALSNLQIDTNW